MRSAVVLLGLGLLSLGAGCGRPAVVASGQLPVHRVVVYRNGVAYFERQGHVDEGEVRFKMKETEVGDFLATLAVMEQGGSSVRAAAFPLNIDDDNDDARPRRKKTEDEKKGLKEVVLTLDGKEHDLQVGYVAESPVWRPAYRLIVEKGGQAQLQAWGIVENLSGEDWKNVKLSLVAGSPLAFESTLGTPVIPGRPIVTDNGDVMAAVPKGETSLAQREDPKAVTQAAAAPPPPDRDGEGVADAHDKNDEEDDAAGAVRHAAKDAKARPSIAKSAAARGPMGGLGGALVDQGPRRAPGRAADSAERYRAAPMAPPPASIVSAPRNLQSLAAVSVGSGTTRYDLPETVTIPDKSATMVLLLSKKVSGEAAFLFAPDGAVGESYSHPFRVVRFKNQVGGAIEKGPIAVFDHDSFLGQGMVEPLPDGATATVPFALERSIAVDKEQKTDELGERVARIENGELFIERDAQLITKYRIRNGASEAAKVILKHARSQGARLNQPPKDTEDNVGTQTALIPSQVASQGTTELQVDERTTVRRREDWFSPIANNAVVAYLKDSRVNAATVRDLRDAWKLRDEIVASIDQRNKLQTEDNQLAQAQEETRRNLRAIEKNKLADKLRVQLTERLASTGNRIDLVTKNLVEVNAKLAESQIRFRDLVRNIKVESPLPL